MAAPLLPSPVGRWRALAAVLRRTADELSEPVDALVAFARDDVWQGAFARDFATELELHRRRLSGWTAPALRDVAACLEARAMAEQHRIDEAAPGPDPDPRLAFLRHVTSSRPDH